MAYPSSPPRGTPAPSPQAPAAFRPGLGWMPSSLARPTSPRFPHANPNRRPSLVPDKHARDRRETPPFGQSRRSAPLAIGAPSSWHHPAAPSGRSPQTLNQPVDSSLSEVSHYSWTEDGGRVKNASRHTPLSLCERRCEIEALPIHFACCVASRLFRGREY